MELDFNSILGHSTDSGEDCQSPPPHPEDNCLLLQGFEDLCIVLSQAAEGCSHMYMPENAPTREIIARLIRHPIRRSFSSSCGHIQPVAEHMVYFPTLLIIGCEVRKVL